MDKMDLYGPLSDNLQAAITSVTRLRGQKAYPETVQYWHDLLDYARQPLAPRGRDGLAAEKLADQLERALSRLPRSHGAPLG
jgi:hypothetical protein